MSSSLTFRATLNSDKLTSPTIPTFHPINMLSKITGFLGEVKGELRKASWPWESDPNIKGMKKFKTLIDSTIVVLIAMILLAGFVQFWDFIHVMVVGFFTNLGK